MTVKGLPSTSVSLASNVAVLIVAITSSVAAMVLSIASGASLTGVTSNVKVFDVASNAPKLSCTLKVKLLYALPLALAAGWKVRLPALISANVIVCMVLVMATPFRSKLPLVGKASMRTAFNVWPTSASVKPKSALNKV